MRDEIYIYMYIYVYRERMRDRETRKKAGKEMEKRGGEKLQTIKSSMMFHSSFCPRSGGPFLGASIPMKHLKIANMDRRTNRCPSALRTTTNSVMKAKPLSDIFREETKTGCEDTVEVTKSHTRLSERLLAHMQSLE